MAQDKEQLRIEAELDTSKLKSEASEGFSKISNEEKKIQSESAKTSQAIDNIGNSSKAVGNAIQQTSQQATESLKNISNEAKNTTAQIENIEKATKQIKLQQGIGVVNKAISTLAPVVQNIGSSIGVSETTSNTIGSAISGASAGAMAGAVLGPLGAAGGALIGAATALVGAANELKKSAITSREEAQSQYESIIKSQDDEAKIVNWNKRLEGFATGLSSNDSETRAKSRGKIQREIAGYEEESKNLQILINGRREITDSEVNRIGRNYTGTERQEKIKEAYEKGAKIILEYVERQKEVNLKAKQLSAILEQANSKVKQELWAEIENRPREEAYERGRKIARNLGNVNLDNVIENLDNQIETNSRESALDEFVKRVMQGGREAEKRAKEDARNKSLQDNLSNLKSARNSLGNYKLTDALTRVGGTSGYASQMNGVSSNVQKITKSLDEMVKYIKSLLEKKDSPVGVFVES